MRVLTPDTPSGDIPKPGDPQPYSIFLAGGITGCPDWQKDAIGILETSPVAGEWNVYNPRRDTFDVTDPTASEFQIEWEHKYLRYANEVFFWFPKEGQCMITLLELGWALGTRKNIRVGCHPEYVRAFDVRKQFSLVHEDVPVFDSLETLFRPINFARGVSTIHQAGQLVRAQTGRPLTECKKALEETGYMLVKACDLLESDVKARRGWRI